MPHKQVQPWGSEQCIAQLTNWMEGVAEPLASSLLRSISLKTSREGLRVKPWLWSGSGCLRPPLRSEGGAQASAPGQAGPPNGPPAPARTAAGPPGRCLVRGQPTREELVAIQINRSSSNCFYFKARPHPHRISIFGTIASLRTPQKSAANPPGLRPSAAQADRHRPAVPCWTPGRTPGPRGRGIPERR